MATLLRTLQQNLDSANPLWRFPEQKSEATVLDMWHLSALFAAGLKQAGVARATKVGILISNRQEYVPLLLAIWRLGGVAVPLRPVMGLSEDYQRYLERVEKECVFATIVCEAEEDGEMAKAWSDLSHKRALSLAQLRDARNMVDELPVELSGDDMAIIQYSSGSTGVPKGVIVTHAMVLNQVRLLATTYEQRAGFPLKSSASWLPFNHDMGLFIGILLPLYCNVPNMLVSPRWYMMNPLRWFKLMSEHQVGLNFTTNAAMAHSIKLLGPSNEQPLQLGNLTLYFGAEKVTATVLRRALEILPKLGVDPNRIHVGYGMAENALGATATPYGQIRLIRVNADQEGTLSLGSPDDTQALEIASIGVPFVETTVEVRDESGHALPDLVLGEICVKGPCVTPGYFRNPEASSQVLSNGWLRTNDTGFTYQGELYFHSRKDDLIIIGGRNIVPDDVEHCVETLPSVRAGATTLLSLENASSGVTELHLLVETKPPESSAMASRRSEIQEHLFKGCALLVNHIHFCGKGSIEKTSSGKKRRKVIRERFIKKELTIFG